jgi:hypothetical protein
MGDWVKVESVGAGFTDNVQAQTTNIMSGGILTLSVETRQRAEGKEEGCKAQGNNDCLGGHDITKRNPPQPSLRVST